MTSSRLVPRYDAEYGEPWRHPLELGERRVFVNRQMRSRAGRPLQVGLQHRRPVLRVDFLQTHLLATTMAQNSLAPAASTLRTQLTSSPSMDTR